MKVGDKVTIKKMYQNESWYHNEEMTIIYELETLYNVDFIWYIDKYDDSDNKDNTIHKNYVELSESEIRRKKLDSL